MYMSNMHKELGAHGCMGLEDWDSHCMGLGGWGDLVIKHMHGCDRP